MPSILERRITMFDFTFQYSDGNSFVVQNINRVIISTGAATQELSGDNILSVRIPLKTIHLFSEKNNVTVSGNNLLMIKITKVND